MKRFWKIKYGLGWNINKMSKSKSEWRVMQKIEARRIAEEKVREVFKRLPIGYNLRNVFVLDNTGILTLTPGRKTFSL